MSCILCAPNVLPVTLRDNRRASLYTPAIGCWLNTNHAHSKLKEAVRTPLSVKLPRRMLAVRGALASAGMAALTFTPAQSLVGGVLLGSAAAVKLLWNGRILGISGIVGGIAGGDASVWRTVWVLGLLLGGFVGQVLVPLQALPASYTMQRAAVSGLLIGLGSSMGSGCTSGHGVCGNARLSPRSLAFTGVFMVAGMVAAHLAGSPDAIIGPGAASVATLFPNFSHLASVSLTHPQVLLAAAGAGALAFATLVATALPKLGSLLIEMASGFATAAALFLSGMVDPGKVVAFLCPLDRMFDPSLALVMGGALLVATPAFQYVLRSEKRRLCGPLCSAVSKFELPTKTDIDLQLLLGGLLFGMGWGIGGTCPGPGLLSLMAPRPQAWAFVASMLSAMALHKRVLAPWMQRRAQQHAAS